MNIEKITFIAAALALLAVATYCRWWYKHWIKNYVKEEQRQREAATDTGSIGKDKAGSGATFNDLSQIDDWFPQNELTPGAFSKN